MAHIGSVAQHIWTFLSSKDRLPLLAISLSLYAIQYCIVHAIHTRNEDL
jgi:hypothetical protein